MDGRESRTGGERRREGSKRRWNGRG